MVRPASDKEAAHNTLSAAFASMLAVGAPNPFAMGPMRIDDPSSSSRSGRSRSKDKKISGFKRAGRSMSPFRFGSKKDVHRSKTAENSEASESDGESIVSSASGIIPRNSAFHVHDDEEDDPRHPANHADRRVDSPSVESPSPSLMPPRQNVPLSSPLSEDGPDADGDVESVGSESAEEDDYDPIVLDNTLYNAEYLTAHTEWAPDVKEEEGTHHFETYEDEDLERDDEHITAPNVVLPEASPYTTSNSSMLPLSLSRPRFERNRCTLLLSHGDADAAAKTSKRPKRYVVASDGSEESSYAVEWTIGTVLRDGDEMLVVSVMETDAKLDALDPSHEEVSARLEHQRIRQAMATVLAKQVTHLLERTRLQVRISCQAIHAKNSRHMLLDLIDFYEPTMVIVGSRGLGSLRGILLGSTSNYLLQKSSAPVMVVRKRLKLPELPRGKGDVVESVRARHMRLDEALIEKRASASEDAPADTAAEDTAAPSKVSKSGSTVIPHTSLEREAETRTQIKQRKAEAAKLHEDERKTARASDQVKLRATDTEETDDGF